LPKLGASSPDTTTPAHASPIALTVLDRHARAIGEFADQLGEFIVETRKSLFQSSAVPIDATDKPLELGPPVISLRRQQLDQLAPPVNHCVERPGPFVG
jgi:hypothetical protein